MILFTPDGSKVFVSMTQTSTRFDSSRREQVDVSQQLQDRLSLTAARALHLSLGRALAAAEEHDAGAERRAKEAEFEKLRKELGK